MYNTLTRQQKGVCAPWSKHLASTAIQIPTPPHHVRQRLQSLIITPDSMVRHLVMGDWNCLSIRRSLGKKPLPHENVLIVGTENPWYISYYSGKGANLIGNPYIASLNPNDDACENLLMGKYDLGVPLAKMVLRHTVSAEQRRQDMLDESPLRCIDASRATFDLIKQSHSLAM